MRLILFCCLVSVVYCHVVAYAPYTYKNETLKLGSKREISITGRMYLGFSERDHGVIFYAMDYSTMTPIRIYSSNNSDKVENWPYFDLNITCVEGNLGFNRERLSGFMVINGTIEKTDLKIDCITGNGDHWIAKTSNIRAMDLYYQAEEAGLRAKELIGQSREKFKAPDVIMYAISGYPYGYTECYDFAKETYKEAPGPEPGLIVVGKNGNHCGILDNEGTKFIHTNPVTKKVTYESIAVLSKYFKEGVLYKRYNKM